MNFREIWIILLNSELCIVNFTYNSESTVLTVHFLPVSAFWKVTYYSENKFTIKILFQASQAGSQLCVFTVIGFYLYLNAKFGIFTCTAAQFETFSGHKDCIYLIPNIKNMAVRVYILTVTHVNVYYLHYLSLAAIFY